MESGSFRSQLGAILFLMTIFFLNFISRIVIAPMMPTMEEDLSLDHAQAGLLFLLIALGYCLALMGSGYFSSRLTHRRTIILSTAAVGLACCATSFSSSLWGLRAGLLVLGMGAGLYLPSGIAVITSLTDPRHWGKAIGLHELAPNLAYVAAPLLCDVLLLWFSWRVVLNLIGLASIGIGIAFAFFGRGGEFPGEAPAIKSMKTLFRNPAFWIMIVLFSLGISGTGGIYAMLPLYLVVERNMDQNWANSLISISRMLPLAMAFFSGWAADWFGVKRTMTCSLLLTGILTVLMGLGSGFWTIGMILLQAMLAGCFFPAGFACLSSIGPPGQSGIVVAFTMPLAYLIGCGVAPTLIGIAGDAGSFALGIALTGVLIIAGAALSSFLKLRDPSGSAKGAQE